MKTILINDIEQAMQGVLNNEQMSQLRKVLEYAFRNINVSSKSSDEQVSDDSVKLIDNFLSAKRVEGCSDKSIHYYRSTLNNAIRKIGKNVRHITTDDLRNYLNKYQQTSGATKVTVDNIRRILSSFFSWLEDEDYIVKSPVRRIHKVKVGKTVKETYTDEALEQMRDYCDGIRDLALIDLLASTGMRVGELVKLNREDIDFQNRECIVTGKGDKQRKVYFDARTKIHLQRYLNERNDNNPALFVSLLAPYERLQISGVEIRLRRLGRELNIPKVHPHKFRRTLATMAIDKGMPIEQVQHLLGHQSLDTTLQYAMVNQTNVKLSHRKFYSCMSQFIEMFGNPLSPIQKWPIVRLGDYCIVNPTRPKGISDEMEVSFIPMQDVYDDGACNQFINRPYAEVKKGFTYCADGDVIFAKITPCMENGKGAELQGLTNAMGMGSTEFHVLRPISGKSISTWLYHFTKLDIIRKDAAKNMTGTGGQKRVPASYFDNFKIGVPSIDEQMNFAALANQADKSKSYVRIAFKNFESMLGYCIRQIS